MCFKTNVSSFKMINSDESDLDLQNTPPDVKEEAMAATLDLLPQKSHQKYLQVYSAFKQWCIKKTVSEINEISVLAYFYELSKVYKSSSLWSKYSVLKATLAVKENVDIKFPKLIAFLKRQNVGYRPQKSETFTREDVHKFLLEAGDNEYLLMKLVLVIGISGDVRCDELVKMTVDDIEDKSGILMIKIPDSKTRLQRKFVVNGEISVGCNILEMYQKYIILRPPNILHRRFFIAYRAGKCTMQVVGKNTLAKVPSIVAKFLGKSNSSGYTGHCLRRTSATLLVDAGANILALKRHVGWKSTSVAEGYVAESISNKLQASARIMEGEKFVLKDPVVSRAPNNKEKTSSTEDSEMVSSDDQTNTTSNLLHLAGVTIHSATNCTFTIHLHK